MPIRPRKDARQPVGPVGISGATEPPPLILVLLRLLFSLTQVFRAPPKHLLGRRLAAQNAGTPARTLAAGNGSDSADARPKPRLRRGHGYFRSVWTQHRAGASFRSRRLMRTTHRPWI